jgi:sugar/nucleoside kinase (ribokinase family)
MDERKHLVCFGAAHWDIIAHARSGVLGADAPGTVRSRPGGVALNAALGLAALGLAVTLVSAVGDDAEGRTLLAETAARGVVTEHVLVYPDLPTGRYVAIERVDGELVAAVADVEALDTLMPEHLRLDRLPPADAWLMEANLPAAVIRAIAAHPGRPPLFADAVSPAKAQRLRPVLGQLAGLYCNRMEAEAICAVGLNAARAAAEALVGRGVARAVVTNGPQAAADAGPHGVSVLRPVNAPVRSVTGAGDALMAAHLAAVLRGARAEAALAEGLAAAHRHAA